ncbi:MAG: tRNA (adenosine(37)-N6)-threonylcarbamoyltransferase complex transferase subunit TsaD [Candidatus Doudnabacteria bacterium]|nr:tRNA (adenosine(37)-N6)-threonylcarbamoyltransferase complex transferase subunit TsaD [Candidatus Doudnabacteria bacterium]
MNEKLISKLFLIFPENAKLSNMHKSIKILAIESSCDETAACVMEAAPGKAFPKTKALSSIINSQTKLHSKMGGVVPEAAARAHVKNIRPVVESALKNKGLKIKDMDFIAVTQGPGLLPSLMVGVEFAKTLSFATGIPLIPTNHMLGHLYSPLAFLPATSYQLQANFPIVSLVVSGGHTMLVLMEDLKNYKLLGQTVDDAAGESFDKVAKMLGLPYPGGPEVSRLASRGTQGKIEFPRPMIHDKSYNFSFSGLKTAVLYYLKTLPTTHLPLSAKQNICRAFEDAVVDVLTIKTMRAAKEFQAKTVTLSGGVAANTSLKDSLNTQCQKLNMGFLPAPMNLCGDNAEMIALAAAIKLHNDYKPVNFKKVHADPNLEI